MANNEHLFPQEQFQPILEQSMALDGLLPAEEICLAFKDIKRGDVENQNVLRRHLQNPDYSPKSLMAFGGSSQGFRQERTHTGVHNGGGSRLPKRINGSITFKPEGPSGTEAIVYSASLCDFDAGTDPYGRSRFKRHGRNRLP